MREGAAQGGGGLVGPDRIDGIGAGAQADLAARKRLLQLGDFLGAVQPWVKAQHARAKMLADPRPGHHPRAKARG